MRKIISRIKSFSIVNFFTLKLSNRYSGAPHINGYIKFLNSGSLIFGNNVKINSGKNYNIIGGDIRTNIIVKKDAIVIFGNNVGISNSTFYCTIRIEIKDNVLIGGGCKFYDTNFHSVDYQSRIRPYEYGVKDDDIRSVPIVVEENAWIGGHCIILKGVHIGENSVLAAGSVLARDIPKNEIWGGNPAKKIADV